MVLMPDTTALRGARRAAAQLNLEASLLIEDWRQTCADIEYRCVYCEKAIASGNGSIDHFIPMSGFGGGTTITNCILSCRPCNLTKGDSHPEQFLVNSPKKLAHIRAYLTGRQPGQGFQPFWGLLVVRKEEPMTKIETRTTSYTLASGIELHVRNTSQQIALQLRQPPIADTGEPLSALASSWVRR